MKVSDKPLSTCILASELQPAQTSLLCQISASLSPRRKRSQICSSVASEECSYLQDMQVRIIKSLSVYSAHFQHFSYNQLSVKIPAWK